VLSILHTDYFQNELYSECVTDHYSYLDLEVVYCCAFTDDVLAKISGMSNSMDA